MEKTNRTDYKRQFNEEHYKRIGLYLKPDDMKRWESEAGSRNMKMSVFIKYCVEKEIGN